MDLHNAHVVDYLQPARHWYDAALDADQWAKHGNIAPQDAAMLLCRHNPNESDWDSLSSDETGATSYEEPDANGKVSMTYTPANLRMLALRLKDIDDAGHRPRTLRDWHQITIGIGFKYHSWIDDYMEATAPPVPDTAPKQKVSPPAPVATASEPKKEASTPAHSVGEPAEQVRDGWVLKKSALISKHKSNWPTINGDFQSASENGLSKAARTPERGYWYEAKALNWARQRGKLNEETEKTAPIPATAFTGLMHKMKR